jgi:hypothetical protein
MGEKTKKRKVTEGLQADTPNVSLPPSVTFHPLQTQTIFNFLKALNSTSHPHHFPVPSSSQTSIKPRHHLS